ncbi:MAG: arginine--tRNA ligase [Alphaproteobacteria bacterium]|nr:arginine--tRNA ligase [Alphaproteobacteria bacterium]
MDYFKHLRYIVLNSVESLISSGALPTGLDLESINVEPPRDPSHGDVATNAALVLAGKTGLKPREVAEFLAAALDRASELSEVSVAGPGFVNIRLSDAFLHDRLRDVLDAGTSYGDSDLGQGQAVNVEYVSANPTGPLHVGNARGAVFGDALANLLQKTGFRVTREYYINDAGTQVDILARSAHLRYREALDEDIEEIPEGLYPGEYLLPVGERLAAEYGDRWLKEDEDKWLPNLRKAATDAMMDLIRTDLDAVGANIDVFSSESELVEAGRVDEAESLLADEGLIYEGVLEAPKGKLPEHWEPREQTLFRSTAFGDDVDRPLKKSDGNWTYFASDVAYHRDKIARGFNTMIDVWGADHAGHVKRMKAAVAALSGNAAELDVKLYQLVKLSRGGEPVHMSKRAGSFVTISDIVDEVGKDVVRFIMLTRKNDAPLDFDFAAVTEQSRDNPVFYVQYAHARACSVLRNAAGILQCETDGKALSRANLDRLTHGDELALIKLLGGWPRLIETAAEAHEPHRIAFYIHDVASAFHQFWNRGKEDPALRFIVDEDAELTLARAALVRGVATVIASGLQVMGVEPVEEMR